MRGRGARGGSAVRVVLGVATRPVRRCPGNAGDSGVRVILGGAVIPARQGLSASSMSTLTREGVANLFATGLSTTLGSSRHSLTTLKEHHDRLHPAGSAYGYSALEPHISGASWSYTDHAAYVAGANAAKQAGRGAEGRRFAAINL